MRLQIVVLAVGRLKERYWREAEAEYRKRLQAFAVVSVEEVPDGPDGGDPGKTARLEGDRLLARIRERDGVIALDRAGRRFTSEAFAAEWVALSSRGYGRVVFVIGGPYGLSPAVLRRADLRLSFSDFTFPHQLMRVILLEQVYRAQTILAGPPYHK